MTSIEDQILDVVHEAIGHNRYPKFSYLFNSSKDSSQRGFQEYFCKMVKDQVYTASEVDLIVSLWDIRSMILCNDDDD